MEIHDLHARCSRAKALLEGVVAEVAVQEDSSMEWLRINNFIIVFYLDTALFWLGEGHTAYPKTFLHKSPETHPAYFEAGTPILDKLTVIEAMLVEYGVMKPHVPRKRKASFGATSAMRKRGRSEDSGIGVGERRVRLRLNLPGEGRGFQLSAGRAVANSGYKTRRPHRKRFVVQTQLGDFEDEDDLELNLSPPVVDDDADDEWHADEQVNSTESTFKHRAAHCAVTSLRTQADRPFQSLSTTLPKRKPGRPPKLDTEKARYIRKQKAKSKGMEPPNTPESPEEPFYNGRGRPPNMPSLPCPENINPVIWASQSLRCQKARLEGLALLEERSTEESDMESVDEDG